MAIDTRLAKKLDECSGTLERVCREKDAPGKSFVAELRARCGRARNIGLRHGDVVHPVRVADIRISRSRITLGPVTLCAIGIGTMDDPTDAGDEPRQVYSVHDAADVRIPVELVDA